MSEKYHIGSITSGYRPIKKGDQYNRYFPQPQEKDRIVIEDGEVDDTVDLMRKVVHKYLADTENIAPVLKGNSINETCQNIWNFLYHHIQYKRDKRGLEQLRRPARSWADRKTGIDCDCFSIFASSILTNLGIRHAFRITKYGEKHYQHVYVVVPNGNQMIIIDPVLSSFNYEKPYTARKDFFQSIHTSKEQMSLSGIDIAVLSGHENEIESLLGFEFSEDLGNTSEENQLEAMYRYLVSTRNTLANNPTLIASNEDPEAFLKMLDYAIEYWHTDKRDEALEILAQNEMQFNLKSGLTGDEDEDLALGAIRKRFFSKVRTFTRKVGTGIKKAVKTVAKAVVKVSPVTVAARLGFLAALKLNLKKMASKLKWGYASREQAARHGVSVNDWNRSRAALAKVERLFADKLQGSRNSLKDAILKGRAGGLNGNLEVAPEELSGLGEVTAATIAAATPIIVAAIKIIKDSGLFAPGEDTNTSNLSAEAQMVQQTAIAPVAPPVNYTTTPMPTQTMQTTTNTSPMIPPQAPSEKKGALAFIKDNPMVAVLGAGVLAFGAYTVLKPKKKSNSLSGVKKKRTTTRKRSTSTRTRTAKGSARKKVKRLSLQ